MEREGIRLYQDSRKYKPSFMLSVILLVGHLFGSSVIFAGLLTFAWLSGLFLTWLNGLHPFGADIFNLATSVELYFFYADLFISGIVLLAGVFRFLREVLMR